MCQNESWGAISATTEAHSTQRDQPPRMHGPGLWMYEQKEQRVTPVRMIGVNCILWCPGWDGKDLGGKPEQDPGYTSRPCYIVVGQLYSFSQPSMNPPLLQTFYGHEMSVRSAHYSR